MSSRTKRYAIDLGQMSVHGAAAAQAAESSRATTIIYGDDTPVAAIVPVDELSKLAPPEPTEPGSDPLLSLCGACRQDGFVDSILGDFGATLLYRRR